MSDDTRAMKSAQVPKNDEDAAVCSVPTVCQCPYGPEYFCAPLYEGEPCHYCGGTP